MRHCSLATLATCFTYLGFITSQSANPGLAKTPQSLVLPWTSNTLVTNSVPKNSLLPYTQIFTISQINQRLDLGLGSQGEQVKLLQAQLKKLGYFPGKIDGIYGEATRIAVQGLQRQHSLTPDGVVGKSTWPLIDIAQAQREDNGSTSAYDIYMEQGSQAIEEENYPQALVFFEQALAERPNDPDAQKAISQVQGYIDIDKKGTSLGIWLWLLLILSSIILGISGGLFILRSKLGKAKQKLASESIPRQFGSNQSQIDQEHDTKYQNQILNSNTKTNHSNGSNGNISAPPLLTETKIASATENDQQDVYQEAEAKTNKPVSVNQTTRLAKVDSVQELIGDLAKPNPNKRHKAIWELAQKADSRAVKPLVELMIDADSKERGLILEALSQIGTRTIKPLNQALAISLQDDNPEVRKNAIRDLTRIYELVNQIGRLISHAAEDPDEEVQETAKWALKQLNNSSLQRLSGSSNNQGKDD